MNARTAADRACVAIREFIQAVSDQSQEGGKAMTVDEAVEALDAMQSTDPEDAHCGADALLLQLVDPKVREAYARLQSRCAWWAWA